MLSVTKYSEAVKQLIYFYLHTDFLIKIYIQTLYLTLSIDKHFMFNFR